MCCSVLHCVAACCSKFSFGYVCQDVSGRWYIVLQCVACVAVCCSTFRFGYVCQDVSWRWCIVLQCVAVCCIVLQRVVVRSVLDTFVKMFHGTGTFCCSVLQCPCVSRYLMVLVHFVAV